jgi:hypothetical protein
MILEWIANHNFFGKPTIIRKWQCDIFGHNWFTFNVIKDGNWCAWYRRRTGDYPKMRKHNPENRESLQTKHNKDCAVMVDEQPSPKSDKSDFAQS